MTENIDKQVVEGFGDEWSRFDQSALSGEELERMFDIYFNIFPWVKSCGRCNRLRFRLWKRALGENGRATSWKTSFN